MIGAAAVPDHLGVGALVDAVGVQKRAVHDGRRQVQRVAAVGVQVHLQRDQLPLSVAARLQRTAQPQILAAVQALGSLF